MSKINVALITGDHPYDIIKLQSTFTGFEEMQVYPQHILDFCTDTGGNRSEYDALVFYNMTTAVPESDSKDPRQKALRNAVEALGETAQGLVILHHALLAFPGLSDWSEIVGIEDRSFGYYDDQDIAFAVSAPGHPVMEGVADFNMNDETYTLNEPGPGSEILLTTSHEPSMKSIAWCRNYRKSRVFCYQSGHDDTSYRNPSFRKILENGILWSAGRR